MDRVRGGLIPDTQKECVYTPVPLQGYRKELSPFVFDVRMSMFSLLMTGKVVVPDFGAVTPCCDDQELSKDLRPCVTSVAAMSSLMDATDHGIVHVPL